MKSLKRKALSNASALPAILSMCAMFPLEGIHICTSQHGAIAMFAEYIKKRKKKQTSTGSYKK